MHLSGSALYQKPADAPAIQLPMVKEKIVKSKGTLYNDPHQSRDGVPTVYENMLADSLERAFAKGIATLPELVEYLNQSGPVAPNGVPWTEESYCSEMKRLGE